MNNRTRTHTPRRRSASRRHGSGFLTRRATSPAGGQRSKWGRKIKTFGWLSLGLVVLLLGLKARSFSRHAGGIKLNEIGPSSLHIPSGLPPAAVADDIPAVMGPAPALAAAPAVGGLGGWENLFSLPGSGLDHPAIYPGGSRSGNTSLDKSALLNGFAPLEATAFPATNWFPIAFPDSITNLTAEAMMAGRMAGHVPIGLGVVLPGPDPFWKFYNLYSVKYGSNVFGLGGKLVNFKR